MTAKEREEYLEQYRANYGLPEIDGYGMCTVHRPETEDLYDYISKLDFGNGDRFCFRSGGDGDNGEALMTLIDYYFDSKNKSC